MGIGQLIVGAPTLGNIKRARHGPIVPHAGGGVSRRLVQLPDQLGQEVAQHGLEQRLDRVGIECLVLFEVGVHGPAHPVKLR